MHFENNNQRYYMVVGSPLRSYGYTEITFNERDFVHMYNRMTPQELHQWAAGVLLGFGPESATRCV